VRAFPLFFALLLAGCAIDGKDPGCGADTGCARGYVCRGGACMRLTTPVTEAGAGGAGGGGGAGGR
jgi:hypothetical protein